MGVPILEANIREHILLQYQEQLGGIVEASGVANDPQTMEMVMAQAAEQIAQANANQAVAMSPEQQMLLNEKQRIELDEQKANVDAVKDVSELAIKNREVDLKEDELAVKAMTEAGKLALKDKEGASKSMELAARIALDAEKMDSGIDERQANKAIDTFLKVTEMESKDATKKRKK